MTLAERQQQAAERAARITVKVVQDDDPMSPADWDNPSDDDWRMYNEGDVWGVVVQDGNGEVLDSCWGFYGHDYAEQEAARMLAYAIEQDKEGVA